MACSTAVSLLSGGVGLSGSPSQAASAYRFTITALAARFASAAHACQASATAGALRARTEALGARVPAAIDPPAHRRLTQDGLACVQRAAGAASEQQRRSRGQKHLREDLTISERLYTQCAWRAFRNALTRGCAACESICDKGERPGRSPTPMGTRSCIPRHGMVHWQASTALAVGSDRGTIMVLFDKGY